MNQQQLKQAAAQAALDYIQPCLTSDAIIGVGTGSTADCFIDLLCQEAHRFAGAVASSERTAQRLQAGGVRVLDLNDVDYMPVYVDGADEINPALQMIKGGGGALTREKIVASVAQKFVCIVDASKQVSVLGNFPLPVEVLPMAVRNIKRAFATMGGQSRVREGFVTDNGNLILDVSGLSIEDPLALEQTINQWPGVVTNGIFAIHAAAVALVASEAGVQQIKPIDH
ncbi:ribose-5-phosphate isomerase RpiA [Orrella sp. 11846]|uniref:ribose-5-phosphate isomerase RpiA n=1 Tax=Orrella sp. 11846 TaxID=3409913 RepID=UPI003B592148